MKQPGSLYLWTGRRYVEAGDDDVARYYARRASRRDRMLVYLAAMMQVPAIPPRPETTPTIWRRIGRLVEGKP